MERTIFNASRLLVWTARVFASRRCARNGKPHASSRNRRHQCAGITLVEVLVVISVVGMLMALLLPAVQASRESARRSTCQNHLKQLGIAMLNHESAKGCFPSGGWGFAWVGDPDRGTGRNQPGGWTYSLLPYIERSDLAVLGAGESVAQKKKSASQLVQIPLQILHCPSKGPLALTPWDPTLQPANFGVVAGFAQTSYTANGGDHRAEIIPGPSSLSAGDQAAYPWPNTAKCDGIVYLRSQVLPAQIRDGLSLTYLIGEKHILVGSADPGNDQCAYSGYDYDTVRWTQRGSRPLRDGQSSTIDCFGSSHPLVCQFVFCDGSARPISFDIDPEIHRRLGNRQDRMPIDDAKTW